MLNWESIVSLFISSPEISISTLWALQRPWIRAVVLVVLLKEKFQSGLNTSITNWLNYLKVESEKVR